MGEIIIHGDCLVGRASELHQLFHYHLHEEADEQVEIDMATTGRCDLSFFQVICAAARSFPRQNKILKLRSPLPTSVINQFHKSGLQSFCEACFQDDCPLKAAVTKNGKET